MDRSCWATLSSFLHFPRLPNLFNHSSNGRIDYSSIFPVNIDHWLSCDVGLWKLRNNEIKELEGNNHQPLSRNSSAHSNLCLLHFLFSTQTASKLAYSSGILRAHSLAGECCNMCPVGRKQIMNSTIQICPS